MVTLAPATTAPVAPFGSPEGDHWAEPDLHLFPQDGQRYEIVDGCLHITPHAPKWHDDLARGIVTTLRSAAPPGWWVCDRIGVSCGESNLVPDVAVLRPRSSGATWNDPADVALAVEVITPVSRRYDEVLKLSVYAEWGIRSLWLVEPGPGTPVLRAYELGPDGYQVRAKAEGAEPVRLDAPYPMRISPASWL